MNLKILLIFLVLSSLVSCERISGDKIWTFANETQCANAWDHINAADRESRITQYLESKDIKVFNPKIETYSYGPFCEACGCPSGRRIEVLILESDLDAIQKLGFNQE